MPFKVIGATSKAILSDLIEKSDISVGDEFGMLSVVSIDMIENMAECLCSCGKTKYISISRLLDLAIFDCGCIPKTARAQGNIDSIDNNTLESIIERIIKTYRGGAKKRNISWNITNKEAAELIKSSCYYCGRFYIQSSKFKISKEFEVTGIDRLDNNIGYEITNCVSCCPICNRLKNNYSIDDFLDTIRAIATHLKLCEENSSPILKFSPKIKRNKS